MRLRRIRILHASPAMLALLGLLCIVTTDLVRAECRSSGDRAAAPSRPLRFDSEIVRLSVVGDSLEVEGIYRLECGDVGTTSMALFYPYPVDSLLGGARTILLEGRPAGDEWRSLPFTERPGRPGVSWKVPVATNETVEVRTVYRQALRSTYARYIVTTTQAWGQPLSHARFEIRLPAGTTPTDFSFPFELHGRGDDAFYLFEEPCFMPDRDIVVRWSR